MKRHYCEKLAAVSAVSVSEPSYVTYAAGSPYYAAFFCFEILRGRLLFRSLSRIVEGGPQTPQLDFRPPVRDTVKSPPRKPATYSSLLPRPSVDPSIDRTRISFSALTVHKATHTTPESQLESLRMNGAASKSVDFKFYVEPNGTRF